VLIKKDPVFKIGRRLWMALETKQNKKKRKKCPHIHVHRFFTKEGEERNDRSFFPCHIVT